ncbi:MAG: alpha/beta hydrolase, partial [Chloroflexota bacterium]
HSLIEVTNKVRVETKIAGDPTQTCLLFIPGLGANASQFEDQLRYFSKQYYAVAISLRGHGLSTFPLEADVQDFKLSTLANDLLIVMSYLNIEKFHIIGNSTGGLVAYEILRATPKRVKSITTFGTTAELHSGILGNFVVILDHLLGPFITAMLAKQTVSKNKLAAHQVADMIKSTPKEVIINTRRNLLDYDYLPILEQNLSTPMLLIQGEYDSEINSQLHTTQEILNKGPHNQIAKIESAGHFANLDKPTQFNQILEGFLTNLPSQI